MPNNEFNLSALPLDLQQEIFSLVIGNPFKAIEPHSFLASPELRGNHLNLCLVSHDFQKAYFKYFDCCFKKGSLTSTEVLKKICELPSNSINGFIHFCQRAVSFDQKSTSSNEVICYALMNNANNISVDTLKTHIDEIQKKSTELSNSMKYLLDSLKITIACKQYADNYSNDQNKEIKITQAIKIETGPGADDQQDYDEDNSKKIKNSIVELKTTYKNLKNQYINLSNLKLSRLNLNFTNLQDINFDQTTIIDSSFASSLLDNASFRLAKIKKTSMKYVNLTRTNFDGASFIGVTFNDATLDQTSLVKADLCKLEANFLKLSKCNLTEAKLSGSNITCASKISHCSFKKADLSKAHLQGHFLECNLKDANLTNAALENLIFENVNLEAANFEGANLKGCKFRKVNLKNACLSNVDLSGVEFDEVDLTGVHFFKETDVLTNNVIDIPKLCSVISCYQMFFEKNKSRHKLRHALASDLVGLFKRVGRKVPIEVLNHPFFAPSNKIRKALNKISFFKEKCPTKSHAILLQHKRCL